MKLETRLMKLAEKHKCIIPRQGSLAYRILLALLCGERFSTYTADQYYRTPSAGRRLRELVSDYNWGAVIKKQDIKRNSTHWVEYYADLGSRSASKAA